MTKVGCPGIAVLFLLPLISMAQQPMGQSLPPADSKARLQQLGDSMRKYDVFYGFDRNGLAVVASNSKTPSGESVSRFGLVNEKGELVLPCEHDWVSILTPNLFSVNIDGKHGAVTNFCMRVRLDCGCINNMCGGIINSGLSISMEMWFCLDKRARRGFG